MTYGVFEDLDSGDVHVAPVENAQTGSTRHTMDGTACWCCPHRQDDAQSLIVHNDPS